MQDDVEIGANTTVDRGASRDTVIGEGTKIDNLVQIAHNVVIGRHCVIVSGVGISGSTTLEDYVVLGGQVGVVGHLRIGRGSQIAGSVQRQPRRAAGKPLGRDSRQAGAGVVPRADDARASRRSARARTKRRDDALTGKALALPAISSEEGGRRAGGGGPVRPPKAASRGADFDE